MAVSVATRAAVQQRLNGLLAVVRQLVPSSTVEMYALPGSWIIQGPSLSPSERTQIEWLAEQVIATGEAIIIDDVQDLPQSKRQANPAGDRQSQAALHFFAGFPIGAAPQQLGALMIITRTQYHLTREQQQAIAILAAEIGCLLNAVPLNGTAPPHDLASPPAELDTVVAHAQQSPTSKDYQSVMRLSMALQSCLAFEDLTNQLVALLPVNLPIHAFEIVLNLENNKSQQLCYWSSDQVNIPSNDELICQIPDPFDGSQPFDIESSEGNGDSPMSHRSNPWRCYQLNAQKRNQGTLKLYLTADAAEHFAAENSILDYVADQISVTLRRLVLLRKLQAESLQDPLTKLFNRRHMMGMLGKLLKRVSYGRYQVGLIMLDLDHFKHLNDTYGHDAGDQVLSMVGLFLKGHARPNDIVCRFGGEEFVLILPGITWEILERRASQLCRGLHYLNPKVAETPLQITISAGFAIAPVHAKTPSTLIKAADTALYTAKYQGRDRAVGAPLPTEPEA